MTASPDPLAGPFAAEGFTLGEILELLWKGRWTILCGSVLALLLAGFYLWRTTPIYEMNALLQVQPRQAGQSKPALEARVDAISDMSTEAQGEAEILQSNQVLGRAVQTLHLDLVAAPAKSLLLGTGLIRRQNPAPRLDVEMFDVPESARGVVFTLTDKGDGAFDWRDGEGNLLAQGRAGAVVEARWQGLALTLKVRSLVGKPGQDFTLVRQPLLGAIEALRRNMTVAEKGKETNILLLTLEHEQPVLGAQILNSILDQYNREDSDRKSVEAAKTLGLVRAQLAELRGQQLAAERLLNQAQAGARSTDLGEEARLVLQRSVEIEKQVLELNQKKAELLRTYTEQSDVVATLEQQIRKLQEERVRLDSQVKGLPGTQQQVTRLMRDVQVDQDRYNALQSLESINDQQLQMAKAGEVGNTRIVDYALPGLKPVKPQKPLTLGVALVLGALAGVGLVMLRHVLYESGVVDPRALEAAFGIPVLATIPHSENQNLLVRQARRKHEPAGLLTTDCADDLAVESLRSLRTSLHFTMVDAPNRVIMIAGASPGIGKSFVCVNFASVLAQFGNRVLLVDADMRRGKLHHYFGTMGRKQGLSEILADRLDWRKALHHGHGIDLISTGMLPPNPSGLLSSERFTSFLAEVGETYDLVLIDAPPVLAATDAVIVGGKVGTVLLLVKDGQHPLGEVRAALQCLDNAGVKAKGFVFNDVNMRSALFSNRRYTYHYAYGK